MWDLFPRLAKVTCHLIRTAPLKVALISTLNYTSIPWRQTQQGLFVVKVFTTSVFHKGKFRTPGQTMCFWETKSGRKHSYCNY